MVGVAENDFGVEIYRLEFFKANAFNGAGGTDRHEDGRLNLPASRGQQTRPRLTVVSSYFKFQRLSHTLTGLHDFQD